MNTIKVKENNRSQFKLIQWGGDDPFTHTLCVGPTRCGKTATILKPLIYSILLAKSKGTPCGLSIIEPKGDVARMVKEMAEGMELKEQLVYIDPLYPDETNRINVMKGDKLDVAEATVAVLKSLFGKQDAFFATVQELSSRKVTLLLKELYGDNMDIMDVLANLRDSALLQNNVERLRQDQGTTDLVQFFDNELLGTGNMAEKYRQFIVGLRAQLENITSNDHLRAIVTGKSDLDLDEHFEKGHILAVNTALGKLGRAGDAFGMFMAMHLQLATFRRKGTERTRVPHYLIIDEYSRYINPDVERFLSIAAEYRVALIAAIQSLGQLELESGNLSAKAMKRAILTSTRNKIVFGGLEYEDAEEVSKIMGKDVIRERSRTYSGGILENILPKQYKDQEEEKERFYSTFLMDGLPKFHYIHKLLVNGTPQEPGVAVGDFVPKDWKEQLEAVQLAATAQKPPIWDWRNRFTFNVNKKRLEEAEERRKKAQVVLAVNPFDEVEVENTRPVLEFPALSNQQQSKFNDNGENAHLKINETPKEVQSENNQATNTSPLIFTISNSTSTNEMNNNKEQVTTNPFDSHPYESDVEIPKDPEVIPSKLEASTTVLKETLDTEMQAEIEIVPTANESQIEKQSKSKIVQEVSSLPQVQTDKEDESSFW